MKLIKCNLIKLLRESKKLTFLVGAGCSVDLPSNLSTAKSMMKAIIEYSCPKSEIQKILNIKELRFEELVQLFRDILDPDLTILDYYGKCTKPNLQHMFLAQMIKKGNFVITTNFDALIEYALLKIKTPKEAIIPVSTKEDFEKYNNPYKLIEESKYPVYKMHGSVKNIISSSTSSQDVKTSLISTLDALGSHKKGTNLLSVEYYKKPLLEKISENRSLVVIGYSGGDDFDIIPTLKTLEKLENIYWINHKKNEYKSEEIYEIEQADNKLVNGIENIDKILASIKKVHFSTKIYKINIDSSILIKNLVDFEYELETEPFPITPKQWLKEKIKNPNLILKWGFTNKIYYRFNEFNESLRCSEEMLRLSRENNDHFYIAEAYNNIGKAHMSLYNYDKAKDYYKKALKSYITLHYSEGIINIYNSFGFIYYEKGNYNKSIYFYKRAIRIINFLIKKNQNSSIKIKLLKSIALNNIAGVYNSQGYLENSLKSYEESLNIAESIGNIMGMATNLDNLGSIFYQKGYIEKAIEYYNKAKDIFKIIYDLRGEIACTNNIGKLYYDQGNLKEAKKIWEYNLEYAKKNNYISSIIIANNNIGSLLAREGNIDDAMKFFEQSLEISKKLNKSQKPTHLINLGSINALNGNFNAALELIEEAFQISKNSNNIKGIASCINKKGLIYDLKGDSQTAIKHYKNSLEIVQKMEYLDLETNCLNQIGVILAKEKNFDDAINLLMKALDIAQKIKNIYAMASINDNLGKFFYAKEKYLTAYFYFNNACNLFQKLNFTEGQVNCLKLMINITIKQMNFEKALSNYDILIEILCKLKNYTEIGKSFIEKAKIFSKLEKLNLASVYFKRALKFAKKLNNGIKADIYNNLGSITLRLNKINRAIIYLEDAIKLYRKLNIFTKLELCLNTIGGLYLRIQDFSKAFENINESLDINTKINNHMGIASNYKLLGDWYLLQGKKKKAGSCYRNSLIRLESHLSNETNIKHKMHILIQLMKKCKN